MNNIILSGGSSMCLYQITKCFSKQLVPIYDKIMMYYQLLMLVEIKEISIITTLEDQNSFMRLLGGGPDLGMRFEYMVQPSSYSLAQVFT